MDFQNYPVSRGFWRLWIDKVAVEGKNSSHLPFALGEAGHAILHCG